MGSFIIGFNNNIVDIILLEEKLQRSEAYCYRMLLKVKTQLVGQSTSVPLFLAWFKGHVSLQVRRCIYVKSFHWMMMVLGGFAHTLKYQQWPVLVLMVGEWSPLTVLMVGECFPLMVLMVGEWFPLMVLMVGEWSPLMVLTYQTWTSLL